MESLDRTARTATSGRHQRSPAPSQGLCTQPSARFALRLLPVQTRSVRRPPSSLPTAPSKAHRPQGISTFWPLCWPNTTVNPELAPFHSTPPYHHPHASRLPPPTPGSSFMPHHVTGQTSCCCHLRSPLRFTLSSPCLGLVFLPPNSPCRCVHAALQTTARLALLRMGYGQLRPPTFQPSFTTPHVVNRIVWPHIFTFPWVHTCCHGGQGTRRTH